MSVKTWKKEFYPVPARRFYTATPTLQNAIDATRRCT